MWGGLPRQIVDLCRSGGIAAFTSVSLLRELDEVLHRPKFAARLSLAGATAQRAMLDYASIATVVTAAEVGHVVVADHDDDAVLGCALAANAAFVVTGDNHLLAVGDYGGVLIVTPSELLRRLAL